MKSVNTLAGLALAAYAVIALGACSKTSNDSAPAANVTGTCVQNISGAWVNSQNGQVCNPGTTTNNCAGAQYINGSWYLNGQPVNCGYGNGIFPTNGQVNGMAYTDCQQFSNYYGIQYVPVNIGNGQMMCVNYYLLSQQGNFAQVNSNYSNINYWYTNPPQLMQCDPYYGCGGYGQTYYGGYGYNQCQTNVSFGFGMGGGYDTGGFGFGMGFNLCGF